MPTRSTTPCVFATDLHGHADRYAKLFRVIAGERPALVFLGGDLLPSHLAPWPGGDFIGDVLREGFSGIRKLPGGAPPDVALILGNDDLRSEEPAILSGEDEGLWHYVHGRRWPFGAYTIYGYGCIPPTPFRLKDWERYDVSRYVDPGCTHPTEGTRSVPVAEHEIRHATIKDDLQKLTGGDDLANAVMLFHTPPHHTNLDRAALDGQVIDHVPLDVHVGSIAVRRFIETRQPHLTLHGHVHEAARITGVWKEKIGRTTAISAAHDGPELCLVRFNLEDPAGAGRELL
jgi:Icc-related predicted phosphoesterase